VLLLLVVSFFPARVSCFCPGWLGPSTSYLCLPGSGIIGTYDIYSFLSSLCLSKMQRVLHTCGFTQSGTIASTPPPHPSRTNSNFERQYVKNSCCDLPNYKLFWEAISTMLCSTVNFPSFHLFASNSALLISNWNLLQCYHLTVSTLVCQELAETLKLYD
jgi:hypothetical protein